MKVLNRFSIYIVAMLAVSWLAGCSGSGSSNVDPFLKGGGNGGGGATSELTWVSDRIDETERSHLQIVVVQNGSEYSARSVKARYSESSPHVSFDSEGLAEGYEISKGSDGQLTITGLDRELTRQSSVELHQVDGRVWSPSSSGVFSRWQVTYEGQRQDADSFVHITTGRSHWNGFIWISLSVSRDLRDRTWTGDENSWPNSGFDESSSDHIAKLKNCENNEVISVPAGNFNTCRVDEGDGLTIWYGNVRSGIVRLEFAPEEDATNIWQEVPGTDSGIKLTGPQVWELQEFGH